MRTPLFGLLLTFLITAVITSPQAKGMYENLTYLKSFNEKGKAITLSAVEAKRAAFVKVLIRLTGDLMVGYLEEVRSIPDDYITGSIIKSVESNNSNSLYHVYFFNPQKVNAIIEKIDKVIWPMPRPVLALFLRKPNAQGNIELTNAKQISPEVSKVFLEAEYERGVSINFLATSDIYCLYLNKKITPGKADFAQKILEKYGTRYLSIIDIVEDRYGFYIEVNTQLEGTNLFFQIQGKELIALLTQVANKIIDQVYTYDIQQFQGKELKYLVIRNINNYQSLVAVIKEIKQVRGFLTLDPIKVKGKDIMYRIKFLGSPNSFITNLDKLTVLEKISISEAFSYLLESKYIQLEKEENMALLNLSSISSGPFQKVKEHSGLINVENERVIVFDYITNLTGSKSFLRKN